MNKSKKIVTAEEINNPKPEEITPEAKRQARKTNNAFDLPERVAKVQHCRNKEVFNVLGIVDNGREFICALTRTQVVRDNRGRLVKDKVTGKFITETVVTGQRTMRGRDVFRIA